MNNINPWKYVDAGDISNNPYFKKAVQPDNKDQEKQNSNPEAANTRLVINGIYSIIEDTTYAKAVHEIHDSLKNTFNESHPIFITDQNSRLYRPLSFKENIETRVSEYSTDKNSDGSTRTDAQKLKLFNKWIDSCTGIAYKKNSGLFKIDPICNNLITIPKDFNTNFLPIIYSGFPGTELNSNSGLYNQSLSLAQALEHPAWIAALEDDKTLLKEYATITFNILKTRYQTDKGMGFYVQKNTATDELRALCVNNIVNDSNACGNYYLIISARFLLVAPRKKI